MHKEDPDTDQGDSHQYHPCQVGLHPIHSKERPA